MASVRGVCAGLAAVLLLAGCTAEPQNPPSTAPSTAGSSTETTDTSPDAGPAAVAEQVRVLAEGLESPWSVLRLGEWTLISQRDSGTVVGLSPEGDMSELLSVDGVRPGGEGGLLGLAHIRVEGQDWLYAYYTAAADNRVVRYPMNLGDEPTFGEREDVLTGIAAAANHNGGRLAFGPDDKLYVTTGDAGQPDTAQDPDSLSGKILRVNPDGSTPGDNPENTPVYSLGHRNPQGLTWDAEGQLWAAEFGQDTYDELNRIEPGGNYGWPEVEGPGTGEFEEPARSWPTAEASPSGLTYTADTLFLAGLGGQRLFAISSDASREEQFLIEEEGRLRDVIPGPEGTLWILTNNTDGRGQPGPGDDRLLEYSLD